MKTTKYNKSEILKEAWKEYKSDLDEGILNASFSFSLKIAWKNAKAIANVNINSINSISKATQGSVWNNRIYFNTAHGAVYYDFNNNTMGIKKSDLNSFTSDYLNSLLSEKATQLQSIGIDLR